MKPKIGITSYIRKDEFRNYSQVGYEYVEKVEQANGIPMIFPVLQNYEQRELEAIVKSVDGIIFTGGCNVEAEWYGEYPQFKETNEDVLRNNFERDLFTAAKKFKKPILGVCRGCQLINVMQGGTLIQDIKQTVSTTIFHYGTNCPISQKLHKIAIAEDSKLKNIYNENEVVVNSFHDQCIKEVGQQLKAVAKCSEDGIIEGVEYQGDFYMTGVQWHPEGMDDQNKLFEDFINACIKSSENQEKQNESKDVKNDESQLSEVV